MTSNQAHRSVEGPTRQQCEFLITTYHITCIFSGGDIRTSEYGGESGINALLRLS